jgi:hypothetical protein
MYRLIKGNCIREARNESLKNEFIRMGFVLIEDKEEKNGEKADDIKPKKTTAPKKRKAVKKNEGQAED